MFDKHISAVLMNHLKKSKVKENSSGNKTITLTTHILYFLFLILYPIFNQCPVKTRHSGKLLRSKITKKSKRNLAQADSIGQLPLSENHIKRPTLHHISNRKI
jgi:hypothetical protein